MSQNVPTKKIQVEERRRKVSELYLKNMSMTKLSEIFGVDRKTIQRDLKNIKFTFVQSRPSDEMYLYALETMLQHAALYETASDLFQQAITHEQTTEYLRILNKMWATKAQFLAKIGMFDALPAMIDEQHDLGKQSHMFLKARREKRKMEEAEKEKAK